MKLVRYTLLFCTAATLVGLSLLTDSHCDKTLDGEDSGHSH